MKKKSEKFLLVSLLILLLACSLTSAFVISPRCNIGLVKPSPSHKHYTRLYESSSPLPEDVPNKKNQKSIPSNDSFQNQRRNRSSSSSLYSPSDSSLTTTVPSYKSILIFVSTTILIWLSEPLLSLVDTTFVGRQAGSLTQLAALSPATVLIDSLLYLTYFLSIATTCKMAKSLATRNYKSMIRNASQIMGIAGVLGGLTTFTIFSLGKQLLTWCAGNAGNPALIGAALEYCKIRCSVSILSIIGMVCQSICLAVQDTKTPAIAVLVASIINIVGDFLFIPQFGLKGAAIATATASVASALVLLKSIQTKTIIWKQLADKTSTSINGVAKINGECVNGSKHIGDDQVLSTMVVDGKPFINTTTRAIVANDENTTTTNDLPNIKGSDRISFLFKRIKDSRLRSKDSPHDNHNVPFISLPDYRSTLELMSLAGPIFLTIMAKVVCYASLTLKATSFGMMGVATHNIMMRIFYFHATFGDSLTQAAQTYLPSTLLQDDKRDVKLLLKRLMVIATYIGIFNFISTRAVLKMGHLFSSNAHVVEKMASHTTFISLAALLHGYIMILEGAIIATSDFTYLVATYAVAMGSLFYILKEATPFFGDLWFALLLFQFLRLIQFKSRLLQTLLMRQSNKNSREDGQVASSTNP